MRYDQPDGPTKGIVKDLRKEGASVAYVKGGNGEPDILIGWGLRYMLLVEVKSARGALSDKQIKWHAEWRGVPVVTAKTTEEVRAAMRAIDGRSTAWMPR